MLLLQELLLLPGDLNGDRERKYTVHLLVRKKKKNLWQSKKYFDQYHRPIKVSVTNGQLFEKVPKVWSGIENYLTREM